MESVSADVPPLAGGHGFMGFDFKDGMTFDQARAFAELLNETITTTSYTGTLPVRP
jgi:hypothetical protein